MKTAPSIRIPPLVFVPSGFRGIVKLTRLLSQISVITTLVSALAATVNGVPIIDKANQAVTMTAQTGVASARVAYSLVRGRLNNIQGSGVNMPGPVSAMNSSLLGATAPTEIKTDTFWPTYTPTGTFTGPYTIHMTEAAPATFDTSVTGAKAQVSPTLCVIRYGPDSPFSNDCLGKDSEVSTMKLTKMTDMPAPTGRIETSPATSTVEYWDYNDRLQYWYIRCLPLPVERRPKPCATLRPSSIPTDSLPTLELTTVSTDMPSTELWMELTTISSMITPTSTKEATSTGEPFMDLTTITSLSTPTPIPTDEGVIVVTVTSTVIETEDLKIEYTFAKVDSPSAMTLRG